MTAESALRDAAELALKALTRRRAELAQLRVPMQDWVEAAEALRLALALPAGSLEATPVFVVDHIGSSHGEGIERTTVLVGRSLDHHALAKGARLYAQASAPAASYPPEGS